jgi:hypothetical protein
MRDIRALSATNYELLVLLGWESGNQPHLVFSIWWLKIVIMFLYDQYKLFVAKKRLVPIYILFGIALGGSNSSWQSLRSAKSFWVLMWKINCKKDKAMTSSFTNYDSALLQWLYSCRARASRSYTNRPLSLRNKKKKDALHVRKGWVEKCK